MSSRYNKYKLLCSSQNRGFRRTKVIPARLTFFLAVFSFRSCMTDMSKNIAGSKNGGRFCREWWRWSLTLRTNMALRSHWLPKLSIPFLKIWYMTTYIQAIIFLQVKKNGNRSIVEHADGMLIMIMILWLYSFLSVYKYEEEGYFVVKRKDTRRSFA